MNQSSMFDEPPSDSILNKILTFSDIDIYESDEGLEE